MKKLSVNPGERFNKLTVVNMLGINSKGFSIAECRCDCGNLTTVKVAELRSGHRRSCGCASWASKSNTRDTNIVGHRYGRLLVEELAGKDNKRYRIAWCKCDCGTRVKIRVAQMLSGLVQSCGCMQKEKAMENIATAQKQSIRHGIAGTPTWRNWCSMIQRCFNPRAENFREYGGAGITACAFLKASPLNLIMLIGERPQDEMSLDRYPNNEGNYTCGACEECVKKGWPKNVRWATPSEQALNRHNNRMIERGGVVKAASEWCKELGLPPGSKQIYTYPKPDDLS